MIKKRISVIIFITTIILSLGANENNFNNFYKFINSSENNNQGNNDLKLEKLSYSFDIVHSILGGMAYSAILAEDALGFALLYDSYNNPSYYSDFNVSNLKIAHLGLMIVGYSLYMINDIIAFIMFGLKIYYKKPINIIHFISSIITSSLFMLEIISMALTGNAFYNNLSYKREMAIAHGVTCSLMALSFTITIITIPIGFKYKKIL